MPEVHPDQQNQSLGLSNCKESQVIGTCGPGRESVGQRVVGWRGGFGVGKEGLCEKVTFEQETEGREGQERATGRAGSRVFWKGKCKGQGGNQLGFP